MDYIRSHFGKMNLWPVEHFFPHFGVPLFSATGTVKWGKKVFDWSEVHLSEVTSYKIHTLEWVCNFEQK